MRNCFVVDGRFITDHARDRVFEFGWEDGIRFLSETVPELDYKLSVELLAGRQQFAGDSTTGLDVAPEEPAVVEEVAERYRWTYAGIYYDRRLKRRFVPYARVTSWDRNDLVEGRFPNRYHPKPGCRMLSETVGGCMRQWSIFRCVAYMDDPIEDRVILVDLPQIGGQMVLWKEFRGTVPLWWSQLQDPELAAVEWVRTRGFPPERGASCQLPGPKPIPRDLSEVVIPRGIERPDDPPPMGMDEQKTEFFKSLLPPGTSDAVADGLMRSLAGGEGTEYIVPKPTEDLVKTKWAWVDKSGKVYPCRGFMDHIPLAHAIIRTFSVPEMGTGNNAERQLELAGWVKIGTNAQNESYAYAEKGRRTDKQRDIVFEWFAAQKADPGQIKRWVEGEDGFDY